MNGTSSPDSDAVEDEPVAQPKRPAVSVVMPAYNTGRFIAQAIRSVLRQTFADWELIIIDDGSTDDTPDVVVHLMESRIRYFRTENLGLPNARNVGITKARGDFVAFLDSDDIWFPHKLAVQLRAFRQDPEVGLCYTSFWYITEDGVRTSAPRFALDRLPYGWCLQELLVRNGVLGGGTTVMVRRPLLDVVGEFDTSLLMCEDWDLWCRLAEVTKFRYIASAVAAYRVRSGSLSTRPHLMSLFGYMVTERAFARRGVRDRLSRMKLASIRRLGEAVRLYNMGSGFLRAADFRAARDCFLKSCRTRAYNFRQIVMLFVSLAARLPLVNRRFLLKATRK